MIKQIITLAMFAAFAAIATPASSNVAIVEKGQPRATIYVAPEVMAADINVHSKAPFMERETELQRRRLRESVNDLALYVQRISGARLEVQQRPPAATDETVPILIGQYAVQRFGAPKEKSPFKQGWRMVVSPTGIGLMGQSDESASYAIYEVLDRLGCRWFIPGEMGEYVPRMESIHLPTVDVSSNPSTEFRGVWYADDAYVRRNRFGGFKVDATHALDSYLTKEQLTKNPEWNAERNGVRQIASKFLCWGNPEVAVAISDTIIERLNNNYRPTISLSPHDGIAECECTEYCKPLDAGDFDPTMGMESLTDRYMVLCNRIAERVTKQHPDVQFGFLAYVQYTRPPVREKPHPNLVPQIAPITYCRAHAMTDDHICPSRATLRPIVEGWGKVANRVSYYHYMYHLAETSVPYPMIHQMTEELPIIHRSNLAYWQPETLPNFESVLPGKWLSNRLAWNASLPQQQVLDELFTLYYGASEQPMRRYWQVFDDAWTNVPAHAGSGWSYIRRFTPDVLKNARAAMDEALAATTTASEYQRVNLHNEGLRQFEQFMQLRYDLSEGRLATLDQRSAQWLGAQVFLGNRYADNYAFTKTHWAPGTVSGTYFKTFYEKTYVDAARIAKAPFALVTTQPLREWRYAFTDNKESEEPAVAHGIAAGWQNVGFDDSGWKTTDIAVETWADLGHIGDYGTMWYRNSVKLAKLPDGKKIFLWVAAADDRVQVFVNGQAVQHENAKGEKVDVAAGYATPLSFDITAALKPNTENQIAIAGTRRFINELGTGGLLGPVYLYRDR